ncbi:hypothetical protein A2673_00315 [Candidatus Kaiserbacteria bacterium RIFCSPHIGHO2_01_FULL_50_13]|uniref:Uncharacterized protein n=1 Tax=Candidatus Kaiserbacteria bacterium RIFCSPLOWO2_01_FULL_50_24 TaxID=1798507 RepID=A0A1F6EJ08_9BACT|nr:MAG: hypothetical protein A2673_00315 [Candidatus Kaiserbacteria bacterium RIFCSPHIGHO2_01_FULL_50_13]OGG73625.1 MAG: hypothetical protein A3A34_03035 [Candidatus Kaiserbacteria bacterium RIFCSPLOWO2_01_FULL_50_24]OGG81287.1 MAG: hypothetical protein A3H74_03905 [Candidatus Kaiserbacteria bacterium RIFCSPLOWO2_02_FULL_51_13]
MTLANALASGLPADRVSPKALAVAQALANAGASLRREVRVQILSCPQNKSHRLQSLWQEDMIVSGKMATFG